MSSKYRRIYENTFGPIPKDEEDRSYEIHHIDGNHSNNAISNLQAVSITEHLNIHLAQGDWAAAMRISAKMKIPPSVVSALSKMSNEERLKNGTHNIIGLSKKRVIDGTHNFLGPDTNKKRLDNGTHNLVGDKNPTHQRIAEGTYHFLGESNPTHSRIANGTHNFLSNNPNKDMPKLTCPHCGKEGGRNLMKRYHFDNCKSKENNT